MPSLFDAITIGDIVASNRILMAPLTRGRATREGVPTPIMAEYYSQRAGAGLIITEGIGISRQGLGWPYAPGLWTDAQIKGWKPITEAVHAAGGRVFAQLWHMGRQVHSSVTGEQPVSSSALATDGLAHTYDGKQPFEIARALSLDEIGAVVEDYVRAARNARSAGFDGIEIHAANGYLVDQFIRDNANLRDDRYGGTIENRIRFLCEVTNAVAEAIGPGRTAVRLSPNGAAQGVNDSNPTPVFVAAAKALSDIGIAFLELREGGPKGSYRYSDIPRQSPQIRKVFDGVLVVNSDYDTAAKAQAALDSGIADAVSFGRTFLANPDLPQRLKANALLNEHDVATFYGRGAEGPVAEGYTDYPRLSPGGAQA
jgi:N-ethylmaleimide reductase